MKLYNKVILYSIFIIVIIILYRINIEPKIPKIRIKNLEFVIAVYEEDISWLNKIPSDMYSHIYIYNKGTPKTYNFPKSTVINISNEGYEANTYLTHITERYNKLAGMTVFLPGTAWTKDYKQKKLLFTLDYISKNNKSVIAGINNTEMIKAEDDFSLTSYGGFSNADNRKNNSDTILQPSLLRPYGNWFKYNFPNENRNCLSYNGIVAASRTDIHKRTKAFYSKLLSQINSKSPEVGHYIERSWGNILSIENCMPIYTFIEIREFERHLRAVYNGYDSNKDLKFAVMAIFKNEAMGIREWIEHYQWQGVDEIILLNNGSTDNWKDQIKGFKNVTVLNAPKKHAQLESYNTIGIPYLKSKNIDVVAVLDLDEYMFGTDGITLKEHIQLTFNVKNKPSMFKCEWTMFGSSGFDKQPDSIRKNFVWKKKDIPYLHRESYIQYKKSVFLLKDLYNMDIHEPYVTGEVVKCPPGIQLNHYAIQSKEYYSKVKMTRGDVNSNINENVRDWNYFQRYDFHDEKDTKLRDLLS